MYLAEGHLRLAGVQVEAYFEAGDSHYDFAASLSGMKAVVQIQVLRITASAFSGDLQGIAAAISYRVSVIVRTLQKRGQQSVVLVV